MSTITTRSGKGSPLTNAELDANFNALNTDKLEYTGGATGALLVALGTAAQRPGSPSKGMIRYNSSADAFEGYSGSTPGWNALATGAGGGGDTGTVIDGGLPDSSYAAITAINGGTP